MALLERVTTLIKANLNSLIEKAENPEKLLKQLLLDMQNQFLQVKTQVATAIADQHLLEKKQKESLASQNDWLRKAELALAKGEETLARNALERSLVFENGSRNLAGQIAEQAHHVQLLRDAMHQLEQKMTETKMKADLLIAEHRRATLMQRASQTGAVAQTQGDAILARVKDKVDMTAALAHGQIEAHRVDPLRQLEAIDKDAEIERLLADLKQRNMRAIGPAN